MATNPYFDWLASGTRFANFDVPTGSDMNDPLDQATAGFDKLPTPAELHGSYANYAVATGSANAYVVAMDSNITALADGMQVRFKANAANTATATLNVNSLGAKTIVRPNAAVLQSGDIANGQIVECFYDSTNDRFQIASLVSGNAAPASSFSGTAEGVVDLLIGSSVASASTINLNGTTGNLVYITGTTQINAVTLTYGPRWVIFQDSLVLAHNTTTNSLPGAANITTAAGDRALYFGGGIATFCLAYYRADGGAVSVLPATQAQMEAASSNVVSATPGNMNWHPGIAKAWLKCDSAGAISASHNITSITDSGTGIVGVTIGTDFSSANYAAIASSETAGVSVQVTSMAAGTLTMRANTYTGAAYDLIDTTYMLAIFGDQA